MMALGAPARTLCPAEALAALAARLQLTAAVGVDGAELDGLVAELDGVARSLDGQHMSVAERDSVARTAALIARVLAELEDRLLRESVAQGRDQRLRSAYMAGM